VPRGTTELRIALNSSDGAAANFDLRVTRGGVRDEAMVCTAATPAAYEYCHAISPEPDVWNVEVEAVTGGGEFQVVATVVGGGPVGVDDAYTAFAGRALDIDATEGVLANDDAPLGALSAEVVTAPLHGELALAADGSFVYTAESSYTGNDTFEYRASDGSYATGGVVVLTVDPASQAPDDSGVFGGCSAGGGAAGAPWLVLVLALAVGVVYRRRRSWGQ
jgi:MYXO-CTERM domain-containing protein